MPKNVSTCLCQKQSCRLGCSLVKVRYDYANGFRRHLEVVQDVCEVIMRFWIGVCVVVLAGRSASSASLVIPTAFDASFVQKVTTPAHKVVRYTGTLKVNRTRAFVWAYLQPRVQEICGDGQEVRIIDHDLEQVIVYRVGSLLDPMQLLKRAKPHHDHLYTADYHGVTYTLKLDKQGRIEQIAYKDELDNVVHVRFKQMRYHDRPFNAAELACPVPRGYDRIRGKR